MALEGAIPSSLSGPIPSFLPHAHINFGIWEIRLVKDSSYFIILAVGKFIWLKINPLILKLSAGAHFPNLSTSFSISVLVWGGRSTWEGKKASIIFFSCTWIYTGIRNRSCHSPKHKGRHFFTPHAEQENCVLHSSVIHTFHLETWLTIFLLH